MEYFFFCYLYYSHNKPFWLKSFLPSSLQGAEHEGCI